MSRENDIKLAEAERQKGESLNRYKFPCFVLSFSADKLPELFENSMRSHVLVFYRGSYFHNFLLFRFENKSPDFNLAGH